LRVAPKPRCIPLLQLGRDLLAPRAVRLGRAVSKHAVHVLETAPLGLGHAEPRPHAAQAAENGEEDVGAEAARVLDQRRRDQPDDEVVEPVATRAPRDALAAQHAGEDLRRHRPRHGAPGHAEYEHVDEQEGDRHPALVLVDAPRLVVQADEHRDDDVADGHAHAAEQQQRTAAVLVHRVQRRDDPDDLRDVQDAREHELHVPLDPHGREERRRVVDQGVDADKLLEEHESHADHRAAPVALPEAVQVAGDFELRGRPAGSPAGGDQTRVLLLRSLLVERDLRADVAPFGLHARVRWRQIAQLAERGEGLLVPAFGGEPAGREGKEEDSHPEQQRRQHLEQEGEPVGPLVGDVARAEGDPEGDNDAEDDGEFLQDKERACTSSQDGIPTLHLRTYIPLISGGETSAIYMGTTTIHPCQRSPGHFRFRLIHWKNQWTCALYVRHRWFSFFNENPGAPTAQPARVSGYKEQSYERPLTCQCQFRR